DGRGKRRMTLLMHSILNGKTYTSRYAEDCATDRRSLAALGMTWGVTKSYLSCTDIIIRRCSQG
ncbi:MAG: hypothetical protein NTW08_06530, partial [Gammaproteobacteria bacterium]|nr:hypothetical protein [Gammaproteobacteria bacterium]